MLDVSQTARLKPVSNDSVFFISICLKDRKKVFLKNCYLYDTNNFIVNVQTTEVAVDANNVADHAKMILLYYDSLCIMSHFLYLCLSLSLSCKKLLHSKN